MVMPEMGHLVANDRIELTMFESADETRGEEDLGKASGKGHGPGSTQWHKNRFVTCDRCLDTTDRTSSQCTIHPHGADNAPSGALDDQERRDTGEGTEQW